MKDALKDVKREDYDLAMSHIEQTLYLLKYILTKEIVYFFKTLSFSS